ncbi:MAG: hypothetical protein HYU36_11005 [Planctomycetes bacterium]|nr:hypothetical protein [Planctomycetota bacterium]
MPMAERETAVARLIHGYLVLRVHRTKIVLEVMLNVVPISSGRRPSAGSPG